MPCSVRAYVLGMLLIFSGLTGCGHSHPPPVVPELPDAAAAHKAMELYDTNHDGFLDDKELEKVPGLKAAIKQVDTNHDGKISEAGDCGTDQVLDRFAGSGECRSVCRVTHTGQAAGGGEGGLRARNVPRRRAPVGQRHHECSSAMRTFPALIRPIPRSRGFRPDFTASRSPRPEKRFRPSTIRKRLWAPRRPVDPKWN